LGGKQRRDKRCTGKAGNSLVNSAAWDPLAPAVGGSAGFNGDEKKLAGKGLYNQLWDGPLTWRGPAGWRKEEERKGGGGHSPQADLTSAPGCCD